MKRRNESLGSLLEDSLVPGYYGDLSALDANQMTLILEATEEGFEDAIEIYLTRVNDPRINPGASQATLVLPTTTLAPERGTLYLRTGQVSPRV